MATDKEKLPVWPVRGVSEDTKRKIRVYAASNGLTMAQAITDMVQYAYAAYTASQSATTQENEQ